VAIVGLSPNELRASFFVGFYLKRHGYTVIPVNPRERGILGETCYARLADVPVKIDIVDVFRAPDALPGIAAEAVAVGAGTLWCQFGVINQEGAGCRAGGRPVGGHGSLHQGGACPLRGSHALARLQHRPHHFRARRSPIGTMAQLPRLPTLVKSYPYKPAGLSHRVEPVPQGALALGNRDLIDRIGGQMKKTLAAVYEDLDRINSCATRLSWCLNQAGAKLTKNPHVRMLKGGDGNLYVISADEMIAYLRLTYGKPVPDFRRREGQRPGMAGHGEAANQRHLRLRLAGSARRVRRDRARGHRPHAGRRRERHQRHRNRGVFQRRPDARLFLEDEVKAAILRGLGATALVAACAPAATESQGRETPAQVRRIIAAGDLPRRSLSGHAIAADSAGVVACIRARSATASPLATSPRCGRMAKEAKPSAPTPVGDRNFAIARCVLFAERADRGTALGEVRGPDH
jgi:predicted CoA-binding protein